MNPHFISLVMGLAAQANSALDGQLPPGAEQAPEIVTHDAAVPLSQLSGQSALFQELRETCLDFGCHPLRFPADGVVRRVPAGSEPLEVAQRQVAAAYYPCT